MTATIRIATREDIPLIVDFMLSMQEEIKETPLEKSSLIKRLERTFDKVTWFIFLDEKGVPFGNVYAEDQYVYFSDGKRYYLGGMYIAPDFRGKGYFKQVHGLVESWLKEQGGERLNLRVHVGNERSKRSVASIGFYEFDYRNYMKKL